MLGMYDRDEMIADLMALVLSSEDGARDASRKIEEVADGINCSPVNVAGRLIRHLQEQPPATRSKYPWVPQFIESLKVTYDPKVRRTTTAPAWLQSNTTTVRV